LFPKIFPIIIFIIIISFLSPAYAVIGFEATSNKDGFSLKYNAPFVGMGNIKLENPGDTATITIRLLLVKTAEIEIALNEIISDPGVVNLHFVLKMILDTPEENTDPEEDSTFETDIPIPFGTYGVSINLMGQRLMPIEGHDIEASVLLTKNSTDYVVEVDLPPLIDGQEWSGTATPSKNTINEEVRSSIDDSLILGIELDLEYPSDFLTTIHYKVNTPIALTREDDDSGDNSGDEFKTITLPNGSYHIWGNPDVDLLSEF
jgi:hypothetical protein